MSVRTIALLLIMSVSATALHLNTFAVFELKEELQTLYMNMWELLLQLQYVTAEQRQVVYMEIQHIQSEIERITDLLLEHDRGQHP